MSYCINAPTVIADLLDGEAIIINLKSGRYYSMEGSGVYLWTALIGGHDPATITARLTPGGDAAAVERAVTDFIAELRTEELIREDDQPYTPGELPPPPASYTAPKLNIFTDMESMLLLDPIHKVDEAGWPHPAAE